MRIAIIDAKRTALGKFLGKHARKSAPALTAPLIKAFSRYPIDHVILGCVLRAGLGQNPARQAVLAAGLPNTVPAVTVDRVCGSGMQAIVHGIHAIMSGDAECVVAGGMENMSQSPHLLHNTRDVKKLGTLTKDEIPENAQLVDSALKDGLSCAFTDAAMGALAEKLVTKYDITREAQDTFALQSHQRAAAADFSKEIIDEHTDECIRASTSLEKLSQLAPVFEGTITAGNASGLSDGAAVVLLMSEKKVKECGITPRAYIDAHASVACEPELYTLAPVDAVRALLNKTNTALSDYDLFEVNEAFAVQTLAVMQELNLPNNATNVCGGAIALGHPIGCSGARIVVTLLHALKQRNKKRGIATLCIGGGEALALSVSLN